MIGFAWDRTGTKKELESYVGHGFKLTVGWIESKDETMYIQEIFCKKDPEPRYTMYVWNVPNARAMVASELGIMLGAPVRSDK